jgi:hypothetical protein
MVHTYARAILDGLIEPLEGAELIDEESGELGHPEELARMHEAADPWERGWSSDGDFDQWIRDRAVALLTRMDATGSAMPSDEADAGR